MSRIVTPEEIQNIINSLQGSCQSLREVCENEGFEEEDLLPEQINEIEQEIFLCTTCGWWYEISEMSEESEDGENTCEGCIND